MNVVKIPVQAVMNRDRELWAMALWVERHHGADGIRYIADQIERNAAAGENGGVALWRAVEKRFVQISPPAGEHETGGLQRSS